MTLTERVMASPESGEVNLDYVVKRAEERARHPFHSPRAELPKVLANLDYDQYRQIRFRRSQALWTEENLPFRIEFFHPGYLYQEPVHVYEFTATHWQPIRFVANFFDYGKLNIQNDIPANTGYAGFRILYRLNQPNQWDELGAFLGASYFRLLGKDQCYGQSARGLALDCGETDRPEEFPIFTDWWLGKPEKDDAQLTLYALLDSVSCTGAYQFVISPGKTTVADIEAVLFLRDPKDILAVNPKRSLPIKTIGLAPLTSMFWYGQNSERKFDDYRSGVHDADGLLVHMGNGEVLWCPLDNPAVMRHQIFRAPDIRGFGLLQRERSFSAYQDLFNTYQLEPSVWVQPHGNWGDGNLHLVELSENYEGLDNIVAFWDPQNKPTPMQPYRFGYTLYWQMGEADVKLSENRVVSTRVGLVPGTADTRLFAIDFKGPKLDGIPDDHPPEAIASCSKNATIVWNQVLRNTFLNTWRVFLKMQPEPGNHNPVDMRCTLQNGTNILSETWTYQWSPP
ncbi:MAG TPA: glucan biosynthesis protein G [Candidatus Saccharimonadales bacterium]|nr:glucan biosynthesis protein G [Candidatus Saccharimonadales bacterium]